MMQTQIGSAASSYLVLDIDGIEVDLRGPGELIALLSSVYRRHRRDAHRSDERVRGFRMRVDAREAVPAANLPAAQQQIVDGVAECNGRRVLGAAALERDGRALLIVGATGTGRSTLAVNLLAGGWRLLADEHVLLSADGETAIAHQALLSLSALATPHLPSAFRKAIEASRWYAAEGGTDLRFYEVDPGVVFGANVWAERAKVDAVVIIGDAGTNDRVKTVEADRIAELRLKSGVRVGVIQPRGGAHSAELIDSWFDAHCSAI
jgi:hypothetical protein